MVPSDLHFIIRHGLTGLMFLFFFVFGVWNVEVWTRAGCDVAHSLALDLQPHCSVVKLYAGLAASDWLVLAVSVVIGITLQGVHMALKFRNHAFFTDPARTALAQRVTDVISRNDLNDLQGAGLEFYRQRLGAIARDNPDALYVWVYHSDADDKLVEWARRRRSYHYLGVHFASAFVVGTAAGILFGIANNYPITLWHPPTLHETIFQFLLQEILIACCIIWALGAWRLSRPMLQEADAMELAWSCGRLHPAFKRAVFGTDPPAAGMG
jgi:hypothetical protein